MGKSKVRRKRNTAEQRAGKVERLSTEALDQRFRAMGLTDDMIVALAVIGLLRPLPGDMWELRKSVTLTTEQERALGLVG